MPKFSVIGDIFLLRFAKPCFFSFFLSDTHKLCCLNIPVFICRIFKKFVSKMCSLHYCFWQFLIQEWFMISTYVILLSGCIVIKHFLTYLKKIFQDHECCNKYVGQIALIAKNSKGSIRVMVKVKVKIMVPEYFWHWSRDSKIIVTQVI